MVEGDLPESIRQGLFANPNSYPCWVQFSNGGSQRDAQGKFFRDAKLLIRAPHPIAGIIKGMVAAGLVVEGVGVFGIKPSAGASGLPVAVSWL
jgi:hypothetical protein